MSDLSSPASRSRPGPLLSRWLKRGAALILAGAVLLYVGVAGFLYAGQRALLFRPDTSDVRPGAADLPGAEAITLVTADGERIHAWWKPPADGAVTLLYLHGNGANLNRRLGRFVRLTQNGAGLLAVSWRGYGGSSGYPSEAGLRLDAAAAHDWLAARVPAERLVLFGESLGTGLAIWLASERKAALLALDSPYASIVDIGARLYPWLPVALLSRDPFRSVDLAPRVTMPVVAQHCTRDWLIPLADARRLMAAFPSAPDLAVIDGRCHIPDPARGLLPLMRARLGQAGL